MSVVAVTGAAGFIGRATCRALIDAGSEVRALVRAQLRDPSFPRGAQVTVTGDLAAAPDLSRFSSGCDTVIHLAARVPGRAESQETDEHFDENLRLTERIVRASAIAGVRRFVYVSSVKAVAEETGPWPLAEDLDPNPTEAYGRSKLRSEQIVTRLGTELRLETVIVRPPVVYGPGGGGQFARLATLARLARIVPLPFASIANRRSIVFVGNLASALVVLARHPRVAGGTFFVADSARSTPELISSIGGALGIRPRMFSLDPSVLMALGRATGAGAEMRKLCGSLEVDDSRFRRLTGWMPQVSFQEGIAQTIAE